VNSSAPDVRAIAFSKDRPLQLEGMLRSLDEHCLDRPNLRVAVLWTAGDDRMRALYHQTQAAHPSVEFLYEADFARDVLRAIGSATHLLFLVDDALFVRDFRIGDAAALLDAEDAAIGFSLRLGQNTTYCYPLSQPQALPEFREPASGFLAWNWTRAEHDFGYPLEVSSSLYRARDLVPLLARRRFRNPNSLEGKLARSADLLRQRYPQLLSYPTSVVFCAPMNLVQTVAPNRAGTNPGHSPEALARMFEEGRRIDVGAYRNFVPIGCHEEVELHTTDTLAAPVVSVIIPCFAQATYLPDAVNSVVVQTFRDWELIIVDDGSPDGAWVVAEDLIRRFPASRISLLRQQNAGLAAARNAGIARAVGRFILPLDADDRLDPNMLEASVAELNARPEVGIVYTDQIEFGESDRVVRLPEFDADLLCAANQLSYCALFRRGVWDAVGGYNPNMADGYEDWDFWIASVEKGFGARRLPRPLFYYRVKNVSMYTRAQLKRRELRAQIAANHPTLFTPGRRLKRRIRLLPQSLRWRARQIEFGLRWRESRS
jgi:glycosyltransferase involved in cell wall biosynthesis